MVEMRPATLIIACRCQYMSTNDADYFRIIIVGNYFITYICEK